MMRMLGIGLAAALAIALMPQASVPVEAAQKRKGGSAAVETLDITHPGMQGKKSAKGLKAKGGQPKKGLGSWSKAEGLKVNMNTPKGGKGVKSK